MKKEFDNEEGLHIFIGNISCNGHQIDAIFISKGKIIVIDFKDYGGRLIFSENNPWQIFPQEGNSVFVKGGGSIRNPYQQVNAYRNSLIDFLQPKEDLIVDNCNNINLRHTAGMVVFHNPIEFDNNNLPKKIQSYFDIVDNNTFIHRIKDRISIKLQLSDEEIMKILNIIDVKEENIYDETQVINDECNKKTTNKSERKHLQMLKKLLENLEISNNNIQKKNRLF